MDRRRTELMDVEMAVDFFLGGFALFYRRPEPAPNRTARPGMTVVVRNRRTAWRP